MTIGGPSQILMTIGMQREKSATATAMRMSDVLFGFIWQALFTSDTVSALSLLGAGLVSLSIVLVVLFKPKDPAAAAAAGRVGVGTAAGRVGAAGVGGGTGGGLHTLNQIELTQLQCSRDGSPGNSVYSELHSCRDSHTQPLSVESVGGVGDAESAESASSLDDTDNRDDRDSIDNRDGTYNTYSIGEIPFAGEGRGQGQGSLVAGQGQRPSSSSNTPSTPSTPSSSFAAFASLKGFKGIVRAKLRTPSAPQSSSSTYCKLPVQSEEDDPEA
jgi:hypothetical protein